MKNLSLKFKTSAVSGLILLTFSSFAFQSIDNKLISDVELWKKEKQEQVKIQQMKTRDHFELLSHIRKEAKKVGSTMSPFERDNLFSIVEANQRPYVDNLIDEYSKEAKLLKQRYIEHKHFAKQALHNLNNRNNTNITLSDFNRQLRQLGRGYAKALSVELSSMEKKHAMLSQKINKAAELLNDKFKTVLGGESYEDRVMYENKMYYKALLRAEAFKELTIQYRNFLQRKGSIALAGGNMDRDMDHTEFLTQLIAATNVVGVEEDDPYSIEEVSAVDIYGADFE